MTYSYNLPAAFKETRCIQKGFIVSDYEQAYEAYCEAALEYHGEFARLE